jgi:hypothetical protein
MPRNRVLLSLALAVFAFSTPWTVPAITSASFALALVGAALTVAWYAILVASVHKYGKQALWLLLGAPFALFWSAVFWLMAYGWYGCEHGADCT